MKKNAKPCRWYLLDLPGYLTGELAPHEARLVDRHLEDCPQCSNDLERFRSLDSLLIESLESPRSTLEFQAAFFKRLAKEAKETASEKRSTGRLRYGRMCRRAVVPMAVAAAALLAVVIFRSPHRATDTTVTEPVAARPAAVEPPLVAVAERPMAAVSAPVETASRAIAQNESAIDYSVVREVEPEQAPLAMGETGGSG